MRRTLIHLLVSVTTLGATAARGADGPELTPLTGPMLPMPAPLGPQASMPTGFYRPNRMDVWQNLAVDRSGRWRVRVALFGDGAYYPNGMPYPLLPVRQMDVIPYLLD
jgi:hypothetical protein